MKISIVPQSTHTYRSSKSCSLNLTGRNPSVSTMPDDKMSGAGWKMVTIGTFTDQINKGVKREKKGVVDFRVLAWMKHGGGA